MQPHHRKLSRECMIQWNFPKGSLELRRMPGTKLAPDPCQEKLRLADQIRAVMNELVAFTGQQLHAVTNDDFRRLQDIELLVKRARARKDTLIEQYQEHVMNHRC